MRSSLMNVALRIIVTAIATAALFLSGCDDKPEVPQAVLDQARKQTEDATKPASKRPATQALLTGKRSRTALIPLPLTMDLPPGWGKLDEPDIKVSANLLQGYTPSGGEVQIQLSNRAAIKQEDLDLMIAGGKKEMAEKPKEILKFDVRPLGANKVLERQSVGHPAPFTTYDANMQPHTSEESAFNWTITVLVPNEGAYQRYELNFIGLTKSQYDRDKDFLNSVVDTLRYATDTTPTPAPSPPPPPSPPAVPSAPTSPAATLP